MKITKNKIRKCAWIFVSMLFVVFIIIFWIGKLKANKVAVVLKTESLQFGNIANSVTATGTVQPVDTVAVGTQISGTIKAVYADFNSAVKKGQKLAEIDKSLLLAQVNEDRASLSSAMANLIYQRSNVKRQKEQLDLGAISKADYESALYSYNSAIANLNNTKAQLQYANKNLSYADIYSPIDGTVLSRGISVGQTVAASYSTPTLFTIAEDLSKMQIQASVDEADIGDVKPGQRVSFSVDAYPADTFYGKVKEIRLKSSTSSNVVTYTTIIETSNKDLKLKPGMTANVVIYTKELHNIWTISAQALQFTPDSLVVGSFKLISSSPLKNALADSSSLSYVWVRKGGLLMRKKIIIGMQDESNVQVISGLDKSDLVVYSYDKTTEKALKSQSSSNDNPFMPKPPKNKGKNQEGPPQ